MEGDANEEKSSFLPALTHSMGLSSQWQVLPSPGQGQNGEWGFLMPSSFTLQAVMQVIRHRHYEVWTNTATQDFAPRGRSLNLLWTRCWAVRDFVMVLSSSSGWALSFTVEVTKEWHSWGNGKDLFWVSREPLVSVGSSLLLTLQSQEARLEIKPDQSFGKHWALIFSWNIKSYCDGKWYSIF